MDAWLDVLCDEYAPSGLAQHVAARREDVLRAASLVQRGASWVAAGGRVPPEVELSVGILALLLPPAPPAEISLHLFVRAVGVARAAGPRCMEAVFGCAELLRQAEDPGLARRVLTWTALRAGIDAVRGRDRDRRAARCRVATWMRAR